MCHSSAWVDELGAGECTVGMEKQKYERSLRNLFMYLPHFTYLAVGAGSSCLKNLCSSASLAVIRFIGSYSNKRVSKLYPAVDLDLIWNQWAKEEDRLQIKLRSLAFTTSSGRKSRGRCLPLLLGELRVFRHA